jgi:hypothetical protein
VTPEERLREALRRAEGYEPSPDLFARVRRSIEEDAAHRRRIRRAAAAVAVGLGALLGWFAQTTEAFDGRLLTPRWAVEAAETAVLVALVVVLGPMIRRFGKTYAGDVFHVHPPTGDRFLVLFDIAYYLLFFGYIAVTARFGPNLGARTELLGQLADARWRVGGLVLMMGVLHSIALAVLPVVGLLFSSAWRRAVRAELGEQAPPLGPKATAADRVASAIVWALAAIVVVGALLLAAAVVAGVAG